MARTLDGSILDLIEQLIIMSPSELQPTTRLRDYIFYIYSIFDVVAGEESLRAGRAEDDSAAVPGSGRDLTEFCAVVLQHVPHHPPTVRETRGHGHPSWRCHALVAHHELHASSHVRDGADDDLVSLVVVLDVVGGNRQLYVRLLGQLVTLLFPPHHRHEFLHGIVDEHPGPVRADRHAIGTAELLLCCCLTSRLAHGANEDCRPLETEQKYRQTHQRVEDLNKTLRVVPPLRCHREWLELSHVEMVLVNLRHVIHSCVGEELGGDGGDEGESDGVAAPGLLDALHVVGDLEDVH